MSHRGTGKYLQIAIGISLLCAVLMNVQSQENRASSPDKIDYLRQTKQEIPIRVGVEEVRLDAVVLDNKGHQITDLTADDFEIYQDKKQQEIIASKYISDYQPIPVSKAESSNASKTATPTPAPRLARDAVRRTIVFLVDDYSMRRFTEVYRTRLCLRKFVEAQMQPGDLVAILQTFRGTSALSAFTSDKNELLARIDNIHFKPPYEIPPWFEGPRTGEPYIPQPMAIDFCIRALKDMPGRKFLMLMSLNITNVSELDLYLHRPPDITAFDRIADSALRAGVVIHTLDILGLADNLVDPESNPYTRLFSRNSNIDIIMAPWKTDQQYSNAAILQRQQYNRLILSQKTGGVFLTGNNFFINGLAELEEDMKGYYLLSYIPSSSTFDEKKRISYKKIEIKVKRRGAQVHTRDGFIGLNRSLDAPEETRNPLIKAMFSPFRYKDLNVSMASGYAEDFPGGYQLRAWIHLDGQTLGITNEKDGSHSISVEAVAATSDIDGSVQDSASRQLKLALNDAEVDWIRAFGLKFSLSLHKEKPGGYYVRVAIKDQISDAIGSAYEFIEIPDLNKGSLSLSSIVVLNSKEDAAWVEAEATAESQSHPNRTQPLVARSQALRKYQPVESFEYMAVVYNAKAKKGMPPALESQVVLFSDGKELYRSQTEPVRLASLDNLHRIPIKKSLLLENTLQPGDYFLKLQVRDKQATGKDNFAEQMLQFEISAK